MATETLNLERMARRFKQIAVTERQMQATLTAIASCKAHLKELREEYDGLIGQLRAAARDEGELPLFAELEDK
jgi:hypothetical protein